MSVQADRVVTVPPRRRINEVSQLEQVQPRIAGPALHITINHLTQTNNYTLQVQHHYTGLVRGRI